MRVVIVHESYFGNTEQLAESMATALQHRGHQVTVVRAAALTMDILGNAELLIVGAPTQAHTLPSAKTRKNTLQHGVDADVARARGVRELFEWLPAEPGLLAAACDTRTRIPRWLVGTASRPIAKGLQQRGCTLVAPPESFFVQGTRGPLHVGEVERAAAWASGVAYTASMRAHHPAARPVAVSASPALRRAR